MNIILTDKCNKQCSFCFANAQKKSTEMSLSNFIKILDFATFNLIQNNQPRINLGGGEPTLHPKFNTFIIELLKRNIYFSLISNGLYSEATAKYIQAGINSGKLEAILLNASELNNKNNFTIFNTNYLNLINNNNKFQNIIFSLTLNHKKNLAEEIGYIKWLFDNIIFYKLRISLDYPPGDKLGTYFIENTGYGEKIKKIQELCNANNITLIGDCIFPPCIFKNYKDFEGFKKQVKNTKTICSVRTIPFDIMPDLSYQHCYSASYLKGGNILKFENFDQAYKELSDQKEKILKTIEPLTPCIACQYYTNKICNSLCVGCLKTDL